MVIRLVACQSNASTSWGRGDIGAINSDMDLIIVGVNQASVLGRGLVDVRHIAIGRIAALVFLLGCLCGGTIANLLTV